MVTDVVEKLMNELSTSIIRAHQPSSERRHAINKVRMIEMRSQGFRTTLNCLERAYSKLLHHTFENQWESQIAAQVRDLADAVVDRLYKNLDRESAEKGDYLMREMLEHLQREFKWAKMLAILESAAEAAREQKAQVYEEACVCQSELRDIEQNGKPRVMY